jgi:hypothetical protein
MASSFTFLQIPLTVFTLRSCQIHPTTILLNCSFNKIDYGNTRFHRCHCFTKVTPSVAGVSHLKVAVFCVVAPCRVWYILTDVSQALAASIIRAMCKLRARNISNRFLTHGLTHRPDDRHRQPFFYFFLMFIKARKLSVSHIYIMEQWRSEIQWLQIPLSLRWHITTYWTWSLNKRKYSTTLKYITHCTQCRYTIQSVPKRCIHKVNIPYYVYTYFLGYPVHIRQKRRKRFQITFPDYFIQVFVTVPTSMHKM